MHIQWKGSEGSEYVDGVNMWGQWFPYRQPVAVSNDMFLRLAGHPEFERVEIGGGEQGQSAPPEPSPVSDQTEPKQGPQEDPDEEWLMLDKRELMDWALETHGLKLDGRKSLGDLQDIVLEHLSTDDDDEDPE